MSNNVFYQIGTKNKSFLELYYYLKHTGIQNNKFFLQILDKDLIGVDPYDDKNISTTTKVKIIKECINNYWYFLREVVRVYDEGRNIVSYDLDRANLAFHFAMVNNLNTILIKPSGTHKTTSVICRLLWEFLLRNNLSIRFLDKRHNDSKLNLKKFKDIENLLPDYLKVQSNKKYTNTQETYENARLNTIEALPSARNINTNALSRGMTVGRIWFDDFSHIKFNETLIDSLSAAFDIASKKC